MLIDGIHSLLKVFWLIYQVSHVVASGEKTLIEKSIFEAALSTLLVCFRHFNREEKVTVIFHCINKWSVGDIVEVQMFFF